MLVLDISTSVAGAFCARLLAMKGARVRWCDAPAGGSSDGTLFDRAVGLREYLRGRAMPISKDAAAPAPAQGRSDGSDMAGGGCPPGPELMKLVAQADVLISGWDGGRRTFGLDPPLHQTNPSAVEVVVSSFGIDGPYSAYRGGPMLEWAAGGYAYITGWADRHPLMGPTYACGYVTGYVAAAAAELGLRMRDLGTENLVFDVAAMEVMASVHQFTFSTYAATGESLRRKQHASQVCPMDVFECADGWVSVGVVTDTQYEAFASAVGAAELLTDPRFSGHSSRIEHRAGFDAVVHPWFVSHTADEIVELLQHRQVPAVRLEDVRSILEAPQLRSRDYWMDQDLDGEPGVAPGDPITVRTSGISRTTTPASSSMTSRPPGRSVAAEDGEGHSPLPLSDLVVIDATQYWAGPLATRILADLGATVIKIERPGARMHVHNIGPASDWKMNRGKLSLAVDLSSEEGRAIVRDLARQSHVIVENFRPGAMTRLGLGFEALSTDRSDLVYLSLSGFGQTGPQATWVSYGPLLEAASSIQSRTHYPDGPPTPLGHSLPDAVGGLAGAFAVLNALRLSREDGRSRHIDLSQLETYTAICGEEILAASVGRTAQPHPRYAYRCRGQDEWIVIETERGADRQRAGRLLGCGADSVDPLGRLEDRIKDRDKHELARLLQREGIAAFAVLNAADLTRDPGLSHRGFFVDLEISGKPVRLPGFPVKSNVPLVSMARPAPKPGAHSVDILRRMLDYDDDRVQHLLDTGVVAIPPAGAPANPRAIGYN